MITIGTTVFHLLTSNARQIVVIAAAQTRELGHDAIEPEHLLLGALALERGRAHDALAACGLDLERVRSRITHRFGAGGRSPRVQPAPGQIPFSSAAKGILDASLVEAQALGQAHPHIGSGHVLLALLAPGTSSATLVETLGHDANDLRADTVRLLRLDDPGPS